MIALLQRVTSASVCVAGNVTGEIGRGVLVLVGVMREDSPAEAAALARKVAELRMFEDAEGKMNLSALDTRAEVLVVSQFTLCADTGRGRRPSFDRAAPREAANTLYEQFVSGLRATGLTVATGVFRAGMAVALVNDGPVTFICDTSRNLSNK